MKKTLLLLAAIAPMSALAATTDSIATHQLDGVTVYSTRTPLPLKRLPVKVEVIRPEAIESAGLRDLTDVLKTQSSVDVIQYPGFLSNIGIRGFIPDFSRSRYVSVLINGIPSGTSNLATLGLEGIEQIEVLKGPFSSIYGSNAMGGVINIITKRHTGRISGRASATAGSFSQKRAGLTFGGGITDRLSFDLGASYEAQGRNYTLGRKHFFSTTAMERAILDASTQGKEMPHSDYEAFKGKLRVGYEFSPNWSLDVYEDLFLGMGIPSGGSIWGVYGAGKKDLTRSTTSADLRGSFGLHTLSFNPYFTREQNDTYTLTGGANYVSYAGINSSWGAILQDELRLGAHRLVLGLDSRNQDAQTKRFNASGAPINLYQPNASTRTLGLFAQGNLSFLDDALSVSAGLRADFLSLQLKGNEALKSTATTERFSTLNPNLGLKYELAKGLMAHASFGTAFSAPDAYQKAGEYSTAYGITRGNASLKPETSTTWDLGLSYTNRKLGLQLDASYFDTNHRQKIVRTSGGSEQVSDGAGGTKTLAVTTFANSEKAHMNGLELIASYDFGALADYRYSLRAHANATLMFDSRYQPQGKTDWMELESIHRQNVTFGLDYKGAQGLELGLSARFLGKRFERNWYGSYKDVRPGLADLVKAETPELVASGQLRHPAALVWAASAAYNVNKQIRFGLNLHNLFDEHYTEKDGYHAPGRSVTLSASYRF